MERCIHLGISNRGKLEERCGVGRAEEENSERETGWAQAETVGDGFVYMGLVYRGKYNRCVNLTLLFELCLLASYHGFKYPSVLIFVSLIEESQVPRRCCIQVFKGALGGEEGGEEVSGISLKHLLMEPAIGSTHCQMN
jgi:hypothetical protein